MTLVKEEPLPADAPPLPQNNSSQDGAGENDGGELLSIQNFCLTDAIQQEQVSLS